MKECYKDYENVFIENIAIVPSFHKDKTLKLYSYEDDAPLYAVTSCVKSHISKHYNFEISWDKISNDEELVKKIKNNDDINQPFKNIEYLFDKYFVNNHFFILPTEKYSFIEYNTKTLRVERHLTHNKIINVNSKIYDTCYTDMKTT